MPTTQKRIMDVIISTTALILLSPVFAISTILIKLSSPGPVFFRQTRIGMNGEPFRIFKFRTMKLHDDKTAAKITISGDDRITKIGLFLRKTKIDELPQLINVLLGNMSLIGPRPEVPEYVEKYSPENRKIVLSVRPGLSDFASIRFRNESELLAAQADPLFYYENKLLPAKLRYGRFYAKKAGILLDIKLIIWTVMVVLGWTPRPFRRNKGSK